MTNLKPLTPAKISKNPSLIDSERGKLLRSMPNSGKKKGQKVKKTLIREAIEAEVIATAKEKYTQAIESLLPKLIIAQAGLALGGIKIFAKVPFDDGTGTQKTRLKLLENDEEIMEILSNPELMQNTDYFIVQQKEALHNPQAYMLDRIFGKASQALELTGKDGGAIETNVKVILPKKK